MTEVDMDDLHTRPSKVEYQELYCSDLHKRTIQAIALSEDGDFLASGGEGSLCSPTMSLTGRHIGDDRVLYVTKIASMQEPIASFKSLIDGPVVAIAWLEQLAMDDERMLLVGYLTGRFRLLRVSTASPYNVSTIKVCMKGPQVMLLGPQIRVIWTDMIRGEEALVGFTISPDGWLVVRSLATIDIRRLLSPSQPQRVFIVIIDESFDPADRIIMHTTLTFQDQINHVQLIDGGRRLLIARSDLMIMYV
jgi:hypothetical protein